MSAALIEDSAMSSISTSQLRVILQQTLLTDSLLDAFCIDNFPEVYRQFTNSMDRTHKLNLLLLAVPAVTVWEQLKSQSTLRFVSEPVMYASRPSMTLWRMLCWHYRGVRGLVLICMLAVGAGSGSLLLRQRSSVSTKTPLASEASPDAAQTSSGIHQASGLTGEPARTQVVSGANITISGKTLFTHGEPGSSVYCPSQADCVPLPDRLQRESHSAQYRPSEQPAFPAHDSAVPDSSNAASPTRPTPAPLSNTASPPGRPTAPGSTGQIAAALKRQPISPPSARPAPARTSQSIPVNSEFNVLPVH